MLVFRAKSRRIGLVVLTALAACTSLEQVAFGHNGSTLPSLAKVSFADVPKVSVADAATDWKLPQATTTTTTTKTAATAPAATPQVIAIPALSIPPQSPTLPALRARCSRIVVSGASRQAFFSIHVDDMRAKSAGSRVTVKESKLVRRDFAGESAQFDVPAGTEIIATSAEGSLVLTRNISFAESSERVDLYKLGTAPAVEHIAGWVPVQNPARDSVLKATILGPDRVLTIGINGGTYLWEMPACKPLWQLPNAPSLNVPDVSPDGNYLAYSVREGSFLFDVASGKVVAKIDDAPRSGAFSWHPDGKRLVHAGERITVWDFAAGKTVCDVPATRARTILPDAAWAGDGHIVVARTQIWALDPGLLVWHLAPPAPGTFISGGADGLWWSVAEGGQHLVGAVVPPADASKAVAALKPEELFVAPPGTKVSLKISLPDNAAENVARVSGPLREQIKKNGWEFSDKEQPTKIVVDIRRGPNERLVVGEDVRGASVGQVFMAPTWACKITLVAKDEEAWKFERRISTRVNGTTLLPQESVNDAIMRTSATNYWEFFEKFPEVPAHLPNPQCPLVPGTSKVTPKGLVTVEKK